MSTLVTDLFSIHEHHFFSIDIIKFETRHHKHMQASIFFLVSTTSIRDENNTFMSSSRR